MGLDNPFYLEKFRIHHDIGIPLKSRLYTT